MMQSTLIENYQMIHYDRLGYAGSSTHKTHISIFEQANDCMKIMQYLGIDRGHIVGHSIGGIIALRLAINYHNSVHSLSLLEPAVTGYSTQGNNEVIQEFTPLLMYDKENKSELIDNFMKMSIGSDYRDLVNIRLPGNGFDQVVIDAKKTYFYDEIPAMRSWTLKWEDMKNISQKPVLYVRGSDSGHMSVARQELVLKILSHTKVLVVPKAKHMIQVMNPEDLAKGLANFFANYPM